MQISVPNFKLKLKFLENLRKPPTLKSTRIRTEEKNKKSVKREESQTTILIEENQRSIAKENQTCINAEKSKASIPENQLKWWLLSFLELFFFSLY